MRKIHGTLLPVFPPTSLPFLNKHTQALNSRTMLSYKTSLIVIATMCNILLPIDSYIILEASNTNYSRSNVPILTQIKPVPSVSDTLERSNFTIKRFAAIGDSYATGVGNGQRVDRKCRRYDQAYGYLINDEIRARNGFTDDSKSSFQFLACVGDTVQSVSKTQLSQMEGRFDAVIESSKEEHTCIV